MESTVDSIASEYTYAALPDDSEYIRLFEVCDENAEPHVIACHLSTWRVSEAPPYHAISYTWGDISITETIRLNGRFKDVSKNCADVLRQLQSFKTSEYYWIDAICIDQNAVVEKSHQVGSMGYVFERAERVLACLGIEDEECEYAMRMIDEIERMCDVPSKSLTKSSQLDEEHFFKNSNILLSRVPGMDLVRFSLAVIDLAHRPYFFRVWVLQELLLAKDINFCFGYYIQPKHVMTWHFHHISGVLNAIGFRGAGDPYQGRFPLNPQEYPRRLVDIVCGLGEAERDIISTTVILKSSRPGSTRTSKSVFERNSAEPFELVSLCATRFCHDPRDTIYGTLALTEWNGETPITPDYRKSNFDLAVEYMKFLVYEDHARSLLTNLKVYQDSHRLKEVAEIRKHAAALEGVRNSVQGQDSTTNSPHIRCDFRGKSLEPYMSKMQPWYHAGHSFLTLDDAAVTNGGHPNTILPCGTKPEDFIVWSTNDYGPEALIIRPLESCNDGELPHSDSTSLSSDDAVPLPSPSPSSPPSHIHVFPLPQFRIVGRAWMPQGSEHLFAAFQIFFDPEDFTMYGATSKDPSFEEMTLRVQARMGQYEGPLPPIRPIPCEQDLCHLDLVVCRLAFSSYAVRVKDIEPLDYEWLRGLREQCLGEREEASKDFEAAL